MSICYVYKLFVTVVVYFYLLPCKLSCLRPLFGRISDEFSCVLNKEILCPFLSGARVYAVVDYVAHKLGWINSHATIYLYVGPLEMLAKV